MLKTLFRYFYPKVPASVPPATADQVEVQKAIIYALATYIQRDGDIILAVKVPAYTGATPDLRFSVPNVADFAVEIGSDPYGKNVRIEENPYRPAPPARLPEFTANTVALALNEMVANTASATTVAESVKAE